MANLNRLRNTNFTDNSVDARVLDETDTYSVSGFYAVSAYTESISAGNATIDSAYIETLSFSNVDPFPGGSIAFDARGLTNQTISAYSGVVKGDNNTQAGYELFVDPIIGQYIVIDSGALIYSSVYKPYPLIVIDLGTVVVDRVDVICVDNLNTTATSSVIAVVAGADGVTDQIPEVSSDYYPIAVIIRRSVGDIQASDIYNVQNYITNGADEATLTTTVSCSGYIPLPSSNTKTLLSSSASASGTTIYAANTDGFLDYGIIKIGSEYIEYNGKTRTSFLNCTRGMYETTTSSHTSFDIIYKSFREAQCTWITTPQVMGDTSMSWGIPVGHLDEVGYWLFSFSLWATAQRQVFYGYNTSFHVMRNVDSVVNCYIRGTDLV